MVETSVLGQPPPNGISMKINFVVKLLQQGNGTERGGKTQNVVGGCVKIYKYAQNREIYLILRFDTPPRQAEGLPFFRATEGIAELSEGVGGADDGGS